MPTIVSKEQYFETALGVLAEVGFKGLNIRRMCEALGVTTGSFYHYFGSWQGFVDALFEYWEHRQDRILRELRHSRLVGAWRRCRAGVSPAAYHPRPRLLARLLPNPLYSPSCISRPATSMWSANRLSEVC